MPRKRKLEKKQITIIVQGTPVDVTLYPPVPPRRSWFAYWRGLTYAKSTGQRDLDEALKVAENMLRNGGQRASLKDAVLSDEEFEAIQCVHYGKKQDLAERARSEKSLGVCLDAIAAFQQITGLKPVTLATPDDCAAFQQKALTLSKSWRLTYPNARKDRPEKISPNTVVKWSKSLEAAWERANISAGKKCVRGVVDKDRLLTSNPWKNFTWIGGVKRPIRQFTPDELISILDYFETHWQGVSVATGAVKICLWSWSRLSEFTRLKWDDVRTADDEIHVEIIGKWGIRKWARIPSGLYHELQALRTDNPYIFAAYSQQLRNFYVTTGRAKFATKVLAEFNPSPFADWLQARITDWAKQAGGKHASPHVFRKTALQHARTGADISERVAMDARVSTSVMLEHYVVERDQELRQSSNRTYERIAASLPAEVARRYGYLPTERDPLADRLQEAVEAQNWALVERISAELAKRNRGKEAG